MHNLRMLILPIHEHGLFLHVYQFQIPSWMFCSIESIYLLLIWLNLFILFYSFWCYFKCRVFCVEDHVICKQREFHFFFSYLDSFYFFFCSDCCGQHFQHCVEQWWWKWASLSCSWFQGKFFQFSPLRLMLAVGLLYIPFIMLRYVPSIPAFWRAFIINGCWILSTAFSASIEIIICFFSFNLLMWCITLIDLQIIKESLHSWDKAHLVMMYDLFNMLLDSV